MKLHGLIIPLMCSAALLGGCAVASVQIKSSPAEAARLRSASDKTYTLIVDRNAALAMTTAAVARTSLAREGYRETPAGVPARYRIRISASTRPAGSIAPANIASGHSTGQYVRAASPSIAYDYSSAGLQYDPVRASSSSAQTAYSPIYDSQYPTGTYVYVPTKVSAAPAAYSISTGGGKRAFTHVVHLAIEDNQTPGAPPIWDGVASIRDTNAKNGAYLETLTSAVVRSVGKQSQGPSPLASWAAAWFEAP